jgi:hypothetical protein
MTELSDSEREKTIRVLKALRDQGEYIKRGGQFYSREVHIDRAIAALQAAKPESVDVDDLAKVREALEEAYSQVKELCETHRHPFPLASFERYNAAIALIDRMGGK